MAVQHVIMFCCNFPPEFGYVGDVLFESPILPITIEHIAIYPNLLEGFNLFFNEDSKNRKVWCWEICCYMKYFHFL